MVNKWLRWTGFRFSHILSFLIAPMNFRRILLLLLAAICIEADKVCAANGPLEDRVARLVSGSVRRADKRLAEIDLALLSLPELYGGPRGSRFGFHSEILPSEDQPDWIQIDLGESLPLDSVVVVPVLLPTRGRSGEGYGFPLRFRIEISNNKAMENSTLIADKTGEDYPNPGSYPVKISTQKAEGRYVRMTSTKHQSEDNGFGWAIEELLVLSGNYNVAANTGRDASSPQQLFPNWSLLRVNDSISRLTYPWDMEPSPTSGHLSAPSKSAIVPKWLVIDLEEEMIIDEIRVIPTTSDDDEVVGGRGFPERLTVSLSNDPDFETLTWSSPSSVNPLGYPWQSPFVRRCGSAKPSRYLRVRSKALFARGALHSFSVSEIQAYANGENVALGKPVRASDQTDRPNAQRWSPEFVVDGYSSTHRIVELPEFIDRIIERGALERERENLLKKRENDIEFASASVTAGVGSLGGIALFGWIWMIVRQRAVRRHDTELLREQIARDLHDDVGSNLAGIVLISEVGSINPQASEELQHDFREIKETARQTSDAMRDIVWLIHVGKDTTRDLWMKMRESVELILGDLKFTLAAEPPDFKSQPIDLQLRRHFFFAFKEALHNARKHAQATSVSIRFEVTPHDVTFKVSDNGTGFDPDGVESLGHGLENLHRRAQRVNGECKIESIPERGTTVTFGGPLNRKNS